MIRATVFPDGKFRLTWFDRAAGASPFGLSRRPWDRYSAWVVLGAAVVWVGGISATQTLSRSLISRALS